ncbi:dihydrofolate reductase family protein [Parabacteroides sp. OttesenSCG-928-K15]|nr:dihydrofolate reductase family protein [Parabacteroides sp. OttesenSCG-928-K15]
MNKQGKIKTFSFISLDGYCTKMGGGIDWLLGFPRPKSGNYGFEEFTNTVDCAVINGIYYATLQAYDLWLPEKKKSYIIVPNKSTITPGTKPNFIMLHPEKGFGYVEAVNSIREQTDGDIWLVGDHELYSALMQHGLIDEIILNVVPVTLGNGCSLFSRIHTEQSWTLKNCNRYDNGVVQMRYVQQR